MQHLTEWPSESLRRTKAVLCDIDDTLTWQGQLPAVAYSALERLRRSGLIVIPVTGRPAGWCDHIARMWPVDGVVGENGAFYFRYDAPRREMVRRYWQGERERNDNRARLAAIAERVLAEVPGAAVAADQAYREADLAIDFREDVEPLAMTEVERIVEIFEQQGATAKVSSIHVNGWFGRYDKLAMTRRMLDEVFSIDSDADGADIVFVGDSPNDAPMFGFFPNAVGVANVKDFGDLLTSAPRWVTAQPGGFGFAEFVDALLRARD